MVISEVSVVKSGRCSKGILLICAVIILLPSALILSGCAAGRTGTHVEPSRQDISQIEKVGLCVEVERGFAVRLQYVSNADRSVIEQILVDNLGRFLGSFAYGGVVGILSEYSPDRENTVELKPKARPLDSEEAIGSALLDRFRTAKVFPAGALVASQSLTSARERGIDALFILTVRRWGLRPPLGSEYDTGDKAMAQLELDVNHKLISSATGKILWERDELYLDSDSKSYSLGDFKRKEGLLGSRMEHLLQLVCDRTASEVHQTR